MTRSNPPRSTRKPIKQWCKDPTPNRTPRSGSRGYGSFYGRTVNQKVTQLPLSPDASPLPKALREALHSDPNYHTPTNAKPLQGRRDRDGNIVSPTLIMTGGGTKYRGAQDFVPEKGPRRRLFEEVNEAADATFSDPNFHFRNRPSRKKPKLDATPAYKDLAQTDLPAELTLRQTVTKEVLEKCKKHKRLPAKKIFSTSATRYRAAVTESLNGVPNLMPADSSHLIAGSMNGDRDKCASASMHHNTIRLVTNEAIVRHIVQQTGQPVDIETRAVFKMDLEGRATKLLDQEFNKITVTDPASGHTSSVSFNYKDTQNNGAVPTSLNQMSTKLALHGLFGTPKLTASSSPSPTPSTRPKRKRS